MKRENPTSKASDVTIALGEDWPEIRASVQRICADFPGEYGGAGLPLRAAAVVLEECHAAGCYAAAAHAQMYTMGSLLRHGSAEQKAKVLPKIASGELRLQAFGVTEP